MSMLLQGTLATKGQKESRHIFCGVIHEKQSTSGKPQGSIQTIHGVWNITKYSSEPAQGILLSLRDSVTEMLEMQVSLMRDTRMKDLWSGTWESPRLGEGAVVCYIAKHDEHTSPLMWEKLLPKEYL